jgi:hypothetical protein
VTATLPAPATRPQLTKLAVCFDEAGVPKKDRERRLALCSAHVGRELASSADLTKAEAHSLIELLENDPLAVDRLAAKLPGPAAGLPVAPKPLGLDVEPAALETPHPPLTGTDAATSSPAPNVEAGWVSVKRGIGCGPDGLHWIPPGEGTRYCRCGGVCQVPRVTGACLAVCYCGTCPHYVPIAEPNWTAAKTSVRDRERQQLERRTRARR